MNGPDTRPDWEGRLTPRALLLGCALSFLACCAAGRAVSRHDVYRDFERFHPFISPTSLYYPTASQTRALARSGLTPDRVAVVVGGNSVLYGYAQGAQYLWTKQLQALLGDRYRVFNFALPGGTPGEFGAVAAEALERDHAKVIFLTNVWAGTGGLAGEVDGSTQKYFFWDAYEKGLLSPYPEREARLAELAAEKKDAEGSAELRRRARLDGWLYCQDLWTAFSYHYLSTVWCPLVANSVTRARRRYPDPDIAIPYCQRYSAAADQAHLPVFRQRFLYGRWPNPPTPGPGADYSATPLVQSFKLCFPPPCRRRTLVLVPHLNPHYVALLPPGDQAMYDANYPETIWALEQAGFAATELGRGYTEVDYADMTHVSAEGAGKMAADVATEVRRLARQLGYTE
jgi:hypothetical protein